MSEKSEKRRCLHDELFSLTLMATVQRAHVYAPGVGRRLRSSFQQALQRELEALAAKYQAPVSERDHYKNIGRLADDLSRKCRSALRAGRFRIGPAQKALNLHLKYRWCLGEIPAPPHCQFDYQIIRGLGRSEKWTEMDSLDQYKALVRAARQAAGRQSLPEWELKQYNRTPMVKKVFLRKPSRTIRGAS